MGKLMKFWKKHWTLFLLTITVILVDTIYFWGTSINRPINDSDWAPFPLLRISGITNYFQSYRTYNLPMQNIVGNGSPNFLTPFYLIEIFFSFISYNSAASQISFLFLISVFSAVGMMYAVDYFLDSKFYGMIAGLLYALSPMLMINLIAGGNPGGFWWYMIIPWFVLVSLKSIDKPCVKNYVILSIVTFLLNFMTDQVLFLTILFFAIPISFAKLISHRTKRVNTLLYFIFSLSGAFFMLYLFALPSVTVTLSDASALASIENALAYLRSLPNPTTLFFMYVPNFGFDILSAPLSLAPMNVDFLLLDGIIALLFIVSLYFIRKKLSPGLYSVILSIYCFPLIVLTALILPTGVFIVQHFPFIYAIFPEYFLVPMLFSNVAVVTIVLKFAIDMISNERDNYTMKSNSGITIKDQSNYFRSSNKQFQFRFSVRKSLMGIIALLAVMASISPIIISDADSGGYVHVVDKLQPITYVPNSVISASQELRSLRSAYNMPQSRDLWEPMNGGIPFVSGIIYEDPHALIYPAENILYFQNSSSLFNSYVFLYYSLESLIQNKNIKFGNILQQLGVGFVVVIKNFSFNYQYEKINGEPYNGSLIVDSSLDALVGNPLQLVSILSNQTSLTQVANTRDYTIYLNNEYEGQVFGYNGILNPINPISPYNFTQLESSPLWNGSIPVAKDISDQGLASSSNDAFPLQFDSTEYISNFSGMQVLSPDFLIHHTEYFSGQYGSNYNSVPLNETIAINTVGLKENPLITNFNGYLGNYLNFSGSTSITLPSNYSRYIENSIKKNFTVNVWVNTSQIPNEVNGSYGYESVFGNGRGFDLGVVSTTQAYLYGVLYYNNSGGAALYKAIQPDTWYMATLVYNGTALSFYVNGALVGRQNVSDIYWGTNKFVIGRSAFGANYYWRGIISDLSVSNETINGSQISRLYAKGPGQETSSAPGTLFFFPLTKQAIRNSTVSVHIPGDIRQETIVYSGSIYINSIHVKSNGISYLNLDLSNDSGSSLNIYGKCDLYYLIGTGDIPFNILRNSLEPVKLSYHSASSDSYYVEVTTKWMFLTNTYSNMLSNNGSLLSFQTVDGLSILYSRNIHTMIEFDYKGISPQFYQVFAFSGYAALATLFGFFAPYLGAKKECWQKKMNGR